MEHEVPDDATGPALTGGVGVRPSGRASLRDMRLYRRALRNGWEIPAEAKELAPKRMLEVLRDDEAGERSWVAASKTLVSMTTATTASIDCALRARQVEELAARLDELESRLVDGQHPGAGGESDEQPEDAP